MTGTIDAGSLGIDPDELEKLLEGEPSPENVGGDVEPPSISALHSPSSPRFAY